jgi:hypothetical protein
MRGQVTIRKIIQVGEISFRAGLANFLTPWLSVIMTHLSALVYQIHNFKVQLS